MAVTINIHYVNSSSGFVNAWLDIYRLPARSGVTYTMTFSNAYTWSMSRTIGDQSGWGINGYLGDPARNEDSSNIIYGLTKYPPTQGFTSAVETTVTVRADWVEWDQDSLSVIPYSESNSTSIPPDSTPPEVTAATFVNTGPTSVYFVDPPVSVHSFYFEFDISTDNAPSDTLTIQPPMNGFLFIK